MAESNDIRAMLAKAQDKLETAKIFLKTGNMTTRFHDVITPCIMQ
jgi:hypothetical protein